MASTAEFRKMTTRSSVYLWEFLLEVLEDPELNLFCCWIDKTRREFCVKDPEEIAKLWGIMKHRPFMDKTKFLRAIRYYYTSKLITKVYAIEQIIEILTFHGVRVPPARQNEPFSLIELCSRNSAH